MNYKWVLMGIRPTIGNELQMDLKNALEGAMNTTSVLESYSTFSRPLGLRSHRMSIPFLAHSAMELLDPCPVVRLIRFVNTDTL